MEDRLCFTGIASAAAPSKLGPDNLYTSLWMEHAVKYYSILLVYSKNSLSLYLALQYLFCACPPLKVVSSPEGIASTTIRARAVGTL